MIDAAIVGLGRWGRNLVDAVQGRSARLRFVRGVVRHPAAVADFAAGHGMELSASLADALADSRVSAVVLATPHSLHVEQVLAAAGAGRHVMCEKPLALSRADAVRAVAACERAGVVLGVGQDKRLWPSMRELKTVVASGRLGKLLHVEGNSSNEVSRAHYSAWRESAAESPGASMTATGIHILDAFVNLVGPVRCVEAQVIRHKSHPDPLDTVSVMVQFENQVSGLLCSVRATPFFWRVHVFGDKGSAEAVGETDVVLRMRGENARRVSFEPENALRAELEAFADAIEGRAPYPVSPDQMVQTISALEAVALSMESGSPVQVRGQR